MGNFSASQLADAWDKKQLKREKDLEEWVQDNPQWWAVGLATLGSTGMTVAAGFVDVLRLGEGAAEGGLAGVGKDALRVLSVAGPAVKAVGWAGAQALNVNALRVAVQVKGVNGPCTFQAVNNALQLTRGRSVFVTVRDMAAAVGKPLRRLAKDSFGDYQLGAWVDDLMPVLRNAGANVTEVTGLNNVGQIVGLAQRNRVVIFAVETVVRTVDKGKVVMEPIYHSIVAVKNMRGQVKFADYGGQLFDSVEALCSRWGQVMQPVRVMRKGGQGLSAAVVQGTNRLGPLASKLTAGSAILIEGATVIETAEAGAELAMPVTVVAARPAKSDDAVPTPVVQASYEAYQKRKSGQPISRLPAPAVESGAALAKPATTLKGVQFRLNALGFGAGPVDGIMGPRTTRAVRAFQKAYPPLTADAVPGPKTQAKLVEVCGY